MHFEFTNHRDLWQRRVRCLLDLSERRIEVGLTSSAPSRSRFLLAIHEHGSPIMHIPARPVIAPALSQPKTISTMQAEAINALTAAHEGDAGGARTALEAAGPAGADGIRSYIDAGIPPPKAPVTLSGGWIYNRVAKTGAPVRGKSGSTPLKDTGALYNSFGYEIK